MEDFMLHRDREITLIIVYNDEDKEYADYLFDLISSKENIIAACWTIEEYEQSKASVSSKNYTILIGNNKLTQSKRQFIPKMAFNENGTSYGWLGKSAILYLDLNKDDIFKEYFSFCLKLGLKKKSYSDCISSLINPLADENLHTFLIFLKTIKHTKYINLINIFFRDSLEKFLA